MRLLQEYTTNATEENQAFVNEVNDAFLRVSSTEFAVLLGDFKCTCWNRHKYVEKYD